MSNPYNFTFDKDGFGAALKQNILSLEDEKDVNEEFNTKEYLRDRSDPEEARREDMEFDEECMEDQRVWDVDESQT